MHNLLYSTFPLQATALVDNIIIPQKGKKCKRFLCQSTNKQKATARISGGQLLYLFQFHFLQASDLTFEHGHLVPFLVIAELLTLHIDPCINPVFILERHTVLILIIPD